MPTIAEKAQKELNRYVVKGKTGKVGKMMAMMADDANVIHGQGTVFHPKNDDFYRYWNILVAWCALITGLLLPFEICFLQRMDIISAVVIPLFVIDLLCDAVFIADVYLQMFMFGYVEEDVVHMRKEEIYEHYIERDGGPLDILGSIPLWMFAVSTFVEVHKTNTRI